MRRPVGYSVNRQLIRDGFQAGMGGALIGDFVSNAISVARITISNGCLFSPNVAPIAISFTLWSVPVALTDVFRCWL